MTLNSFFIQTSTVKFETGPNAQKAKAEKRKKNSKEWNERCLQVVAGLSFVKCFN